MKTKLDTIEERLLDLMKKKNFSKFSELEIAILKRMKKGNPYDKQKQLKGNFTKFRKGERELPSIYIPALEAVLETTYLYIKEGGISSSQNVESLGLKTAAMSDDYATFERLGKEFAIDGSQIITNCDEVKKNIFDYIYEFNSINGLEYLLNNGFIKTAKHYESNIYLYGIPGIDYASAPNKVFEIVKNHDNSHLFLQFFKIFSPLENSSIFDNPCIFLKEERVLKQIFDSENIFDSLLKEFEVSLETINYSFNWSGNFQDTKTYMIHPILLYLVTYGLNNFNDVNKNKLNRLLDFGIEYNEKAIKMINDKSSFKGSLQTKVDNQGFVKFGDFIIGNLFSFNQNKFSIKDSKVKEKITKILNQIGQVY